MTDVFTKTKRSEVMASIRGRGNVSTEWRLRARLVSSGISGWKMHSSDIAGKPDIVFPEKKLAVFLDGCFWHGCKKCRSIPKSNRVFWTTKITGNKKRDMRTTRKLRTRGWTVLRFWEHQIKFDPLKCIEIIRKAIKADS